MGWPDFAGLQPRPSSGFDPKGLLAAPRLPVHPNGSSDTDTIDLSSAESFASHNALIVRDRSRSWKIRGGIGPEIEHGPSEHSTLPLGARSTANGLGQLENRQIYVRSVVAHLIAMGTRRLEDLRRQVFNSKIRWIELPMDRSEPPGLISAMCVDRTCDRRAA